MSEDKMREEFEAAYSAGVIYAMEHTSSIQFEDIYKQRAWAAWQVSRAALEVVSLIDYEALKSEHDTLKHSVGRLMEHDFSEDCQECGIGQSDAWAEVKTMIAGAGGR